MGNKTNIEDLQLKNLEIVAEKSIIIIDRERNGLIADNWHE